MNNDNGFYKLLSKYNVLDDIMTVKADIDTLKSITAELDNTINVSSPIHTSYELDRLHTDILKISKNISKIDNDIIDINTQLDELYSDIQNIKNILNI